MPSTVISRKIQFAVIATGVAFVVAGTVGYMIIQDWELIDALYMMMITVTTVGYGTPGELNTAGKAYTIGVSFVAYCMFTTFVGLITYALVGMRFDRVLRRRRMEKKIKNLRDHYIVCGAGRIGRRIINEFEKTMQSFVVIENNRELVDTLTEEHAGLLVLEGDATENEVLERANIDRAKGLLCALDSDSSNVFLSLTARDLNPKLQIVARANEIHAAHKLERAGANTVVSPTEIGALRMASCMIRPHVVNFLDVMIREHELTLRMEEVEIPEGSAVAGQSIADSGIHQRTGLMVIAINTQGKFVFNPTGTQTFHVGDALIVLGTPEQRLKLESLVQA